MQSLTEIVQNELRKLSENNQEYAQFNKRIVNTKKTVLGVRVPDLRKFAKNLAKQLAADDIKQYLTSLDKTVYEQVLLAGLLINYSKLSDRQSITLAKKYLTLVDSWAEIDIFAAKRNKFDSKLWWNFASQCLKSDHEFVVRYGVIEMMANYLNCEYIDEVFRGLRAITHAGYYVRMGMAWLYASAAVEFYEQTIDEINKSTIDRWTKKKALTKMIESYRFTPQQKDKIRTLRAKI